MVEKSKKSVSSGDPKRKSSRRNLAIWLAVVLMASAALAAAVVIGVLAILPQWFEENPRMVVRRTELTSRSSYNSYWGSRKGLLKRRLGIQEPASLWQLRPGDIRKALEDPRKFSSIQSARVYRIPPDTLRIDLVERYPLAIVRKSGLLVDDSAMLFDPRESGLAGSWLPRIAVDSPGVMPGVRDPRLIPAVALISEIRNTNRVDGSIDVSEIRLESDSMVCRFVYGNTGGERRAVFPLRDYERNLPVQLRALRAALAKLRHEGVERHYFDLSFNGQVVIKEDKTEGNHGNDHNNTNNKHNHDRGRFGR